MKNIKSLPLLLSILIIFIFLNTSCKGDQEIDETGSYDVSVNIISPTNNAQLAIGEPFTVEVDYARNENIIHNIKVEIVDMNGHQIQKLVERHAHVANEFTFKLADIKIDQEGTYLVRALTTDLNDTKGDNDKNNLAEHIITIQ